MSSLVKSDMLLIPNNVTLTTKNETYPPNTVLYDETGMIYLIKGDEDAGWAVSTPKIYALYEVETNYGKFSKIVKTVSDVWLVASNANKAYQQYQNGKLDASEAMNIAFDTILKKGVARLIRRQVGRLVFGDSRNKVLKYINTDTQSVWREGAIKKTITLDDTMRFNQYR